MCPRCRKEIHPVRELARTCPRCMGRFHARCAKDGLECTECERVFAPPVLGPFIFDERPFLSTGTKNAVAARSLGDFFFDFAFELVLRGIFW